MISLGSSAMRSTDPPPPAPSSSKIHPPLLISGSNILLVGVCLRTRNPTVFFTLLAQLPLNIPTHEPLLTLAPLALNALLLRTLLSLDPGGVP
jgi:hypothetical protein